MQDPTTAQVGQNLKSDVELSIQELAERGGVDLERGLTTEQAAEKLMVDGPNELTKPPKPTLLMLFAMQLTNFIIVLLMVAAVASIVVNATGDRRGDILSYTTGKAIFVIVLINAGIAAWTEHKAGGALDALSRMSQASVDVVRNGQQIKVETTTVVCGDIVVLGTGDVVPADLRLVEAADVKVKEMALTGEPDDVAKTANPKLKKSGEAEKLTPEDMVFSGCSVTNGRARGIVLNTGMATRIGKIAQLIAGENSATVKTTCGCFPDTSANATPLQKKLESLGARIGGLAIVVV
jgi:magnesium-transporting ATPase (P-type)